MRDTKIDIRVSSNTKETIKALAAKQGLSTSQYILNIIEIHNTEVAPTSQEMVLDSTDLAYRLGVNYQDLINLASVLSRLSGSKWEEKTELAASKLAKADPDGCEWYNISLDVRGDTMWSNIKPTSKKSFVKSPYLSEIRDMVDDLLEAEIPKPPVCLPENEEVLCGYESLTAEEKGTLDEELTLVEEWYQYAVEMELTATVDPDWTEEHASYIQKTNLYELGIERLDRVKRIKLAFSKKVERSRRSSFRL